MTVVSLNLKSVVLGRVVHGRTLVMALVRAGASAALGRQLAVNARASIQVVIQREADCRAAGGMTFSRSNQRWKQLEVAARLNKGRILTLPPKEQGSSKQRREHPSPRPSPLRGAREMKRHIASLIPWYFGGNVRMRPSIKSAPFAAYALDADFAS